MNHPINGAVTISLPARFHGEQAGSLRQELEEALTDKISIILDFSNVEYIDSSGVTALMTLNKAANARSTRLTLRGMNDDVRSFFALTRLDTVFTIE